MPVSLEELRLGEFDAAFGKAFPIGADRQQLAVDQDPVAVEDDEIPAHPASRSGFGVDDDDRDVVDGALAVKTNRNLHPAHLALTLSDAAFTSTHPERG